MPVCRLLGTCGAPPTVPAHHLFLADAWEQFAAARHTLLDYAKLAYVSNRTAVMPFVALDMPSPFVGLPYACGLRAHGCSGSSERRHPASYYIMLRTPTLLHDFDLALRECGGSAPTGVVVRPSCDGFAQTEEVRLRLDEGGVAEAARRWGVRRFVCVRERAIDVDAIGRAEGCAVLLGFRGLWSSSRGKLALRGEHSRSRARTWALVTNVAHSRPGVTAGLHFSTRAAEWARSCLGDRSPPPYVAVQFRVEALYTAARRWARGNLSVAEATGSCLEAALDRVHATAPPGLPLYIATDLPQGGQGSNTFGGRSTLGSDSQGGGMARRLARIVHTRLVGRRVLARLDGVGESCGASELGRCANLECYFMDLALFVYATHGYTFAKGNSATLMASQRGGINTTRLKVQWDAARGACAVREHLVTQPRPRL